MQCLKPRSFAWDTLRAGPAHPGRALGGIPRQGRCCTAGTQGTQGAGSLGKLAALTVGLRWFRQQLRELDHGFKLSHSWMLWKSCSWYWSPLFWSHFRLRRCLTCSGPAFWWHNSRSALTWLVQSSIMLKWTLLTLKTLIQSQVRSWSECVLFLSCHPVTKNSLNFLKSYPWVSPNFLLSLAK